MTQDKPKYKIGDIVKIQGENGTAEAKICSKPIAGVVVVQYKTNKGIFGNFSPIVNEDQLKKL